MRTALKVELKRAFLNWAFVFSIGLGSLLAILAFFNTGAWELSKYWLEYMSGDEMALAQASKMSYVDTPLEIWMPRYGTSSKFYYMWMVINPILCVLPYGVTYLNDKKHGMINQLVHRMGKRNYYVSKLLTCFISGGVVATVPLVLNLLVCMCFLPWGVPLNATCVYPVGPNNVFFEIFYSNPALYTLIFLLFNFVLFGLITSLCMVFALIEESSFALMVTPFVIYFAQHVLFCIGFRSSELSLLNNSSLYLVYKDSCYLYFIELLILLVIDLGILLKIRRDIL